MIVSVLSTCGLFCQTTQTFNYTTKDGLPSNSVYRTILDKNGYLWIATENGLAKFDGKNFKNYTTVQGLPDNEIINLFIDSTETIWALPFRKKPAYYNEAKDRFENSETDAELDKIEMGNTNGASILQYGGMAFFNNNRSLFIYKNHKITPYISLFNKFRSAGPDLVIEYTPGNYIVVCADSLRYISNNLYVKSTPFDVFNVSCEYFKNTLYTVFNNRIKKYQVGKNGEVVLMHEKELPFKVRVICKTEKNLVVTSYSGNIYPVDTATLELYEPLLNNLSVRNTQQDHNGTIWITTSDKGLFKIQQRRISSLNTFPEMLQGFNAVKVSDKIIAGNFYGEIYVFDGQKPGRRISLQPEKNIDGVIRTIEEMKNGYFVSCQSGSFYLDKKTFKNVKTFSGIYNLAPKYAKKLNDSIILLGSHYMIYKYNVFTHRYVDSIIKRVSSIGVGHNNEIYLGSNDGLYRWDKGALYYFGKKYKSLNYRINAIESTSDGLLWIGLGADSLMVLKNDKLIKTIPLGNSIPGNVCKSLCSNKNGEIWLGTNKGLNKIDYRQDKGFVYSNTFFGVADGLNGEQVNDIEYHNDTLYIATEGGINFMPASLQLTANNIATFITKVTINQKDTFIAASYRLPYNQNDIGIEFSGADLSGYLPLFEYSINGSDWNKTDKNTIKLRLSSGKYTIEIRAIKRDGNFSTKSAFINIEIKTPFWESFYFWLLVGVFLFAVSFFIIKKRNQQKQKAAIEKVIAEKKLAEMEIQALKAQINPHFVFNCLNSIKSFIFDKDFEQADKYLDKFSELLRSTLDNSASATITLYQEISYLDNYLQLEKLRFDDKFEYDIRVNPEIDINTVTIPAMLLQPYVENAIRHGLSHLESKKGLLKIDIDREGSSYICTIDDNGVGRVKGTEYRNAVNSEYQSKGMELSNRRAELYNINLEIIDKKDEQGNATGTTVILKYT